jgi:lysozyme
MLFESGFFAALRRMKARRLAQDRPQPAPPPASPKHEDEPAIPVECSIGPQGLTLIKCFEGCARKRPDGQYEAYPDPGTGADPWTIGWGATGKGIRPDTVWTREQCDARLKADLARFARDVVQALDGAPTSQAQFDALVSFHYNTGAIARATLTRLHKAGEFDQAAAQFGKWVHAGGKRLTGLVRRREAEAQLYQSG